MKQMVFCPNEAAITASWLQHTPYLFQSKYERFLFLFPVQAKAAAALNKLCFPP